MCFQISCSRCGHRSRKFRYNTMKTPEEITKAGWNSFGSAFYCPKCAKTWEHRNGKDRPLWGKEYTQRRVLEAMVRDLLEWIEYSP